VLLLLASGLLGIGVPTRSSSLSETARCGPHGHRRLPLQPFVLLASVIWIGERPALGDLLGGALS